MLRKYAVVAALVALAAPLAAQDAAPPTWSSNRPDGVGPAGIVGDRVLDAGAFEAQYRFRRMSFDGVQLGPTPIDPFEVLDFYATTPFQRSDQAFELQLQYGLGEDLSILGVVAWLDRSRDVVDEEFLVTTEASGLSDLQLEALWEVFDQSAIRVHLHGGVEVPLGSIDERDDLIETADQLLAYEMQLGSGSLGLIPGITAQIQNEHGTVGGQVKGRIRLNDNDRDYRLGDEVEGAMWAEYRANEYFAFNSGMRYRSWGAIQGVDAELDPTRDPGEDALFTGGERLDIPVGLNVLMPHGKLAGHRLNVEFLFPVHQEYDTVRLTGAWGFTLAWRTMF